MHDRYRFSCHLCGHGDDDIANSFNKKYDEHMEHVAEKEKQAIEEEESQDPYSIWTFLHCPDGLLAQSELSARKLVVSELKSVAWYIRKSKCRKQDPYGLCPMRYGACCYVCLSLLSMFVLDSECPNMSNRPMPSDACCISCSLKSDLIRRRPDNGIGVESSRSTKNHP